MTQTEEQLTDTLAGYVHDPLGFVMYAFPWLEEGALEKDSGPDQWQRRFLEDLGRHVRQRNFNGSDPVDPIRMAIASGHGIGKSTLMAWLHWWIMCTRPGAKGRVTANTFQQLSTTTWMEIQKWHKLLICKDWFEITQGQCRHVEDPTGWFSTPITCAPENSEAFAGQHNKDSTSFFLFDEASLIPDIIFDVAQAGLTDGEPMFFSFGNPTRNVGTFYEICFGNQAHRWDARSIDSRTCRFPNHELHEEWIHDHGIDSDYVRVRILGLPPKQGEDQLISRELVASAQKRHVQILEDDPLIAGVDVPDGGSSWFVIRFRRGLDTRPGPLIPRPIRVAGSKIDRQAMIGHCASLLAETSPDRKLAAMFVDASFGAAIVERLRASGFESVFEVSFGGRSPDAHYGNMRAFMYGKRLKEWLAQGALDSEDKELASQLTSPGFHFKVGGDGALMLESKEDMRKRGISSPDDADALALTFSRHVAISQPEYRSKPLVKGMLNPW